MAGYGYSYRGYSPYTTPSSDDWSRTSYAAPADHVCRPIITDTEGRKRPVIAYNPEADTPRYVTETVNVQQHVHSPLASEYKNGNPRGHNSWENNHGGEDYFHKRQSSPERFDEYINKVHTDQERPGRFSNGTDWRQAPKSTGYNHNKNGGYNYEHNELYNNKDFQKHDGKKMYQTDHHSYHDDHNYRKQGSTEPGMITTGGWPRPNHVTWSSSPPDHSSLTKPTNDIGEALNLLLTESTKPSVTTRTAPYSGRYAEPVVSAETIDSREAAKRYGNYNFNFSSRPYASSEEEKYTTIIDSREAARKYGGKGV